MDAQIIFNLKSSKKALPHLHKLSFNKVVVFDNRFDTSNIATRGDGIHPVVFWRFDGSASSEIKEYIEAIGSNPLKENKILYINLKQLRFENERPQLLFFSAEAYFQSNKGLIKIATIKKYYELRASFGIESYKTKITNALNDLIRIVNKNANLNSNFDNITYTPDRVNSTVTSDWMDYPIMKKSISNLNGVYGSIEDLRNDSIIQAGIVLNMESDSAYALSFSDKKEWKKWEGNYNIFAIRYNGTLFLKIKNNYFLPLTKGNDKLLLHIPNSLPNMYSIIAANLLTSPENAPVVQPNSVGGLILAIVIESALSIRSSNNYDKTKKQILDQSIYDFRYRNCFLDMDTGDIIYQ